MNDTHQMEYVTLPNRNFGHYPQRSNANCGEVEESYLSGAGVGMGGVTEYQKIRVQPSTMAVVRNDATFVSGSKTTPLDYGQAEDCYSHVVFCKKIGTFHINTLGTKMKVNTDQTWTVQVDSFNPRVESIAREENGAMIDIVCGGWCGGCSPKGDMLLYPNPLDNKP
ncbi:A disintegrin and metalloproteinase with thrombospondin motifs 9-like [Haliotis rufescens]|uniref:A disintegrin and metalloproteinase with thrombospondin motifs 9-like n=1 Tax=Haliotis rufescens TaxID=6454 RepID=UPI00201ED87B|nr:A disintegrin and metalloproteinase with thrombospondin motifs 9-like [Haliotis rufescens]XP_048249856.1 A disintegrin and metalloproteinase with thrombospondin motifs 9-like [Haliotis rufescens]